MRGRGNRNEVTVVRGVVGRRAQAAPSQPSCKRKRLVKNLCCKIYSNRDTHVRVRARARTHTHTHTYFALSKRSLGLA